MSIARSGFTDRLIPRLPTAPAPQAPDRADPAAPDAPPPASGAVFSHFTESVPLAAALGPDDGDGAAFGAVTVSLSPSVGLILKLLTRALGVSADEAIARAICIHAAHVGLPTLAGDHLTGDKLACDHIAEDLFYVPDFERRDRSRFSRAREALGDRKRR